VRATTKRHSDDAADAPQHGIAVAEPIAKP
jgi:hypothetical protein